ncbi:MAG TPA: 3-isopropylmalate dehydratase small subunit [Acidisarcina sp.]
MEAFRELRSTILPLDRANVDTDQIIPKQFLKRIERTGYGDFLFFDWRKDGGFELNNPRYRGAQILVVAKNFGCGSSREHAAWALSDYGFRCVIAPSFADIFHSNAGKNGILLITLPEAEVATLLEKAASIEGYTLNVSLVDETISDGRGWNSTFHIDPFRRDCLLQGLDDIGLTLRHASSLDKFEAEHDGAFWVTPRPASAAEGTQEPGQMGSR